MWKFSLPELRLYARGYKWVNLVVTNRRYLQIMNKLIKSLFLLVAMTTMSFAQAPASDASNGNAILADIALLQTVDPIVTGSTEGVRPGLASPSGNQMLHLCDTACQTKRLDAWRERLAN